MVGDLPVGLLVSEEQRADLVQFVAKTGMQSLLVMPNIQMGGLQPPQGWVGEFSPGEEFSQDPFSCEKFKVLLFLELAAPSISKEELEAAQKVMLKTIPLRDSFAPPTPDDEVGGGWTPALNGQGAFCGVYKAVEKNVEDGNTWDRFYVVVHSALPRQTLQLMEKVDTEAFLTNVGTRTFLTNLDGARGAAGKGGAQKPWSLPEGKKRVTYGEMFGPKSVNEVMRTLAVENALRLALLVGEALQMEFMDAHTGPLTAHSPYRDERHNLQREIYSGGEKIGQALKQWPTGIPIHTFHSTPDGFPLGRALAMLKEKEPPVWEKVRKELSITLIEEAHTKRLRPDLVQDYNTYRILAGGMIAWYSNCSPGMEVRYQPVGSLRAFEPPAFTGVMQLGPLELGLRVAQASFMPPRMGEKTRPPITFPLKPPGEFQTEAAAIPVIFPFEKDSTNQCKKRDVFFSIRQVAEMFKGRFQMRQHTIMNRESVKRGMGGVDLYDGKDSVELEALKVFCPGEAWGDPRYSQF